MTKKDKRILVALEGIPGVGKTSLMNKLGLYDSFEGIEQILFDNDSDANDGNMTLEDALRSDQLKTSAYRKSNQKFVILDRYYQSTLAYHWAADKLYGEDKYDRISDWLSTSLEEGSLIVPDITFFIDIPPQLSNARKSSSPRYTKSNPWIDTDFLQLVREYYLNLLASKDENVVYINGESDLASVETEIVKTLYNTNI